MNCKHFINNQKTVPLTRKIWSYIDINKKGGIYDKCKIKAVCVLLALALMGCAPSSGDDLPDEKGDLSESGASSSVQSASEAETPFERTLYYTSLAVD